MPNLVFLPFICLTFIHISLWATSTNFRFLKSWVFILSMSMHVYYSECVLSKWHASKRCAYRRAPVHFGNVVATADPRPPWQTAVFAAHHLLPYNCQLHDVMFMILSKKNSYRYAHLFHFVWHFALSHGLCHPGVEVDNWYKMYVWPNWHMTLRMTTQISE